MATIGELTDEIRRLLRRLRSVTDREQRTTLIKKVAELAVDLRGQYETVDGRPDWAGKSWAYRDALRQLYVSAGFTPDESKNVQAVIRWHVGNIIRQRRSPEKLEEYGLTAPSPHERVRAGRNERAEIVQAARAAENERDLINALAGLAALVERINADQLAEMPAKDRRRAAGVIARAQRRLAELSEALPAPAARDARVTK